MARRQQGAESAGVLAKWTRKKHKAESIKAEWSVDDKGKDQKEQIERNSRNVRNGEHRALNKYWQDQTGPGRSIKQRVRGMSMTEIEGMRKDCGNCRDERSADNRYWRRGWGRRSRD